MRKTVQALPGLLPALLLAALAILTALAAGGCLFDTREAEDPEQEGEEVPWKDPQDLADALENMKLSLEAQVLTNYGRSFSEDRLVMVLDEGDLAELGENPLEPWSKEDEELRMSGILVAANASLAVEWGPAEPIAHSASESYYEDLTYRLIFEKQEQTVVYSGLVDLWFEDDGTGLYFITMWIDKQDASGNRTWGWLRARNKVEFPEG